MKFGKQDIIRIIGLTITAVAIALNLRLFIKPAGLYSGGASGMALLIQAIGEKFFGVELPYSVLTLLLNVGPVYIGLKYVGRKFTLNSLYIVFVGGILTDIIHVPAFTDDILLASVFGGIISAVCVSICLRFNGSGGGGDIISIYLSRKGIDSWTVMLMVNICIYVIAGLLFGWDKALYSIVMQFTFTQMMKVCYRKYQKDTLFIVTNKGREICEAIYDVSRHGATVIKSEGAFERKELEVVYSVVSADDSRKVLEAIKKVDEGAFVNQIRTEQLRGNFFIEKEE